MITDIVIFIIYICMISTIIHYYVKKLWMIVKTIKYMKLQKILMEKKMQSEQTEEYKKHDPQNNNENDPMFA